MERTIFYEQPLEVEYSRSVGINSLVMRFDIEHKKDRWECDEICLFYKEPHLDMAEIKKAVLDYINAKTDERILSGFVWNGINVWLSSENQRNFSEAQRVALMTNGQRLPVTFNLGEDTDGQPVYHEFTTIEELTSFYLSAVSFIQQCLNDGWQKKDNIDWSKYELPESGAQE